LTFVFFPSVFLTSASLICAFLDFSLFDFSFVGLSLLDYHLARERGLRPWERYRFACGDQVELARKQHRKTALLPSAACDPAGGIARPPIDIGAGGTDDSGAGILRDHQPAEFGVGAAVVCNREVRLDEKRGTVEMDTGVDCDRAPRSERHALRASGFVLRC
jgi:hypothetical protein